MASFDPPISGGAWAGIMGGLTFLMILCIVLAFRPVKHFPSVPLPPQIAHRSFDDRKKRCCFKEASQEEVYAMSRARVESGQYEQMS